MEIDTTEVFTNVATNLVEDAIKGAWSKVKDYFLDLDAKQSVEYGLAYENYLNETRRKNSRIKTIIYRRVPQDLYSFYECIGVNYKGNIINTDSITNLIDIDSKIIITGTGGMGKSILFKHLFLNTIEKTNFIPVLLELRTFNNMEIKDISIYNEIYKTLCENGFVLDEKYFQYSMEKGGYIIFLDGYDEVNREKTGKIRSEIESISSKYNRNKFLVSSRPSDQFIGWSDFTEVTCSKLTKTQALSLINKIEFDESVKSTFYKELNDNLYKKYESFASNPLLLNIMLLTFNKHASIPDKLNDFYEEAFATLFNMHDATKDSYVRDIRTGLGCEDFKLVFSYICFKSYFNGDYEFSEHKLREYLDGAKNKFSRINFSIDDFENDLTMSVCMLIKDGLNYRFSHRSFQEYFAAWYTCKLVDEVQSRLLSGWLKESDSILTDSYISMLFDLQSEKFNKIVLCPALEEVKKMYNRYGFTMDLIKHLFKSFSIVKDPNDEFKMFLQIKDQYLCYSLILNCRLNGYSYCREDEKQLKKIYNKLKNCNKMHNTWKFEEALEIIEAEELLTSLKWFENQILFAISIIEKNTNSSINRKRKVSSIIDEL